MPCFATLFGRRSQPARESLGRRALRAIFYLGGLVAAGAGLDTALRGVKSIAGQKERGDAAVESEVRFYGAIYVGYGLAMLSVAPRADQSPTALRALAATLFAAGLARAGGWHAAGTPHPLQRALLAIELGAPPMLVIWQARLASQGRG